MIPAGVSGSGYRSAVCTVLHLAFCVCVQCSRFRALCCCSCRHAVLSRLFLPSRHFCSLCGRSPSCLAPSTDPPRGCNPPWCATDRGASTVQGSAAAVRTRRCCPADSAGDGQSYCRRSSTSSVAWLCSRFGWCSSSLFLGHGFHSGRHPLFQAACFCGGLLGRASSAWCP